ncbi:hypothetical protein [Muriicola soli]|uniref:DNA-binding protein n=1 Tax=Muriicola soli TaxID=2507538 RepID=A0A411EA43_9FLAO|nr:hypothetical protein [Muriicola soli]QBA64549.1 hypothetical protein EQY75_08430 [Muriicola soli]
MNRTSTILLVLGSFALTSCDFFGPKTTDPFAIQRGVDPEEFNEGLDRSMHEITILQYTPGTKYLYAEVREGDRTYWIATQKQTIVEGSTYLYNEALLKTHFESKEQNRVYDTLYMITALISKDHGMPSDSYPKSEKINTSENTLEKKGKEQLENAPSAGKVSLSDLFANPERYEGKIIQISGTCSKVSTEILGRNWVHVDDGKSGKELVVTLQEVVEKGETLTIEGIVQLNVDLGSGYTYDILLEKGIVLD